MNSPWKLQSRNLAQYDRILLIGDLNLEITEKHITHFCDIYHLKYLDTEPICFKNISKPSCIDLFLTNCSKSLQDTQVLETGFSDFHKMNITALKMFYAKQKHNIVIYRNYKTFENKEIRTKLENELMKFHINEIKSQTFDNIFLSALK